jgi:hypothetical protein
MRRIFVFLSLAFVVWFVISAPEAAAHTAQNIGSVLRHAGDSSARFLTHLTS